MNRPRFGICFLVLVVVSHGDATTQRTTQQWSDDYYSEPDSRPTTKTVKLEAGSRKFEVFSLSPLRKPKRHVIAKEVRLKQSHYVAVTKGVEIALRHRQMPTLWARNDEVGFSEWTQVYNPQSFMNKRS